MKKTSLALAISAATLAATPAFATNGDVLIGLGAKARALGGTGIASFFGSENALTNPALLVKAQGREVSFGGTLFKPSVKATIDTPVVPGTGPNTETSAADTNVIPEVSIVNGNGGDFAWGIGMFGSAGMGVDYSDSQDPRFGKAQDTLQIMKFVPSVAFKLADNFGVGVAPVLQYGALDINTVQAGADFTFGTADDRIAGSGLSQDLGWGFKLGAYFDVNKNLTVGVSYDSPITMKYKNQISLQSQGAFSDTLEQPAVLGAGVAYTAGAVQMTADFKQIKWGDATGYKDFGWENQNVLSLGVKYQGAGYWLGAGFNKGDNPIKKQNGATPQGAQVNYFNYLLFPATTETHFTLGGGYKFNKTVSLDLALVYAPEVSDTVDVSGLFGPNATLTTKHSQVGYTFSLRYDF